MSVEIHHFTFDRSSPAFEIPRTWIFSRNLPQSSILDHLWGKTQERRPRVRTFAACAQLHVCSVFRTSAALSSALPCWVHLLSQDCTALSAGGGTDERQKHREKASRQKHQMFGTIQYTRPRCDCANEELFPIERGPKSRPQGGNAQCEYCGKDRTRWHVRAICARVDKAGRARCAWIQLVVGRRRANRFFGSTIQMYLSGSGFLHDLSPAPLPRGRAWRSRRPARQLCRRCLESGVDDDGLPGR